MMCQQIRKGFRRGLEGRVEPPEQPETQAGFNLGVDLESFYTDGLWRLARDSGWLKPIADLGTVLSAAQIRQLAAGGANPVDGLAEEDALRRR